MATGRDHPAPLNRVERFALATTGPHRDDPLSCMVEPVAIPPRLLSVAARAGEAHARRRLEMETRQRVAPRSRIRVLRWLDAFGAHDELIPRLFRLTRLHHLGRRHFRDLRVVENRIQHPELPRGWDGATILHLSDLHLDIDPDYTSVVVAAVRELDYDLAVITGDYRDRFIDPPEPSVALTAEVVKVLRKPFYGILGNHDSLDMVPLLEAAGLPMLLNEGVAVERRGEVLWLAGIDDPAFFRADNVERALSGRRGDLWTVMLAHGPEAAPPAAAQGIHLFLCGHTHGGQLCLPGGYAPVRASKVEPRLHAGPWTMGAMTGYTSRGTGGCGVPYRLFCPPEITLHRLVRGERQAL